MKRRFGKGARVNPRIAPQPKTPAAKYLPFRILVVERGEHLEVYGARPGERMPRRKPGGVLVNRILLSGDKPNYFEKLMALK